MVGGGCLDLADCDLRGCKSLFHNMCGIPLTAQRGSEASVVSKALQLEGCHLGLDRMAHPSLRQRHTGGSKAWQLGGCHLGLDRMAYPSLRQRHTGSSKVWELE